MNLLTSKNILSNNVHWLLRISLAITFIYHGYPKVIDCSGLISMGMPTFLAYLIGPFEVVGGALLVIGAFTNDNLTRLGALLIAVIMIGAIFVVHINDGWSGMEWQILILSTCILFIVKGNNV